MDVADFDYELPDGAIAQEPRESRDSSRLMVADASPVPPKHLRFREFPQLLRDGDLLVLNDTRVIPARLFGHKKSGGKVELLLLEPTVDDPAAPVWECLLRASRKPADGDTLELGESLRGVVLGRHGDRFRIRLRDADGDPMAAVERSGVMPLPPYIRRPRGDPRAEVDRVRYQTVFGRTPGAIAAPTAGLHFTRELLDRVRRAGVGVVWVTLHVGPATFQPVRASRVEDHVMHSERCELPEATVRSIEDTRRRGGRIVAVGTTVVRTLETAAATTSFTPGSHRTALFIYPGFRFRVVDAMVTNFHLPRSTLLMLVAAFVGRERILDLYRQAIESGYRFYSYGDAMFLAGRREDGPQ